MSTTHPYWRTARVEIAPDEWVEDCWQREDGLTMVPDPRDPDDRWAVLNPEANPQMYPDDLIALDYGLTTSTLSDIHYMLDEQYPWTIPGGDAPMPEVETSRYALLFGDEE